MKIEDLLIIGWIFLIIGIALCSFSFHSGYKLLFILGITFEVIAFLISLINFFILFRER